jgi:hypothetical protein
MAGLFKVASKLAKTTAEMAHELAQKRAALQIEIGTGNVRVRPPSDNVTSVKEANFQYPKTIGNQTVKISDITGGVRFDTNERQRVNQLASKIASPDGYISRIIVDQNNNVIEGQHRLEALRQLGATEVPVYKIEDLADTMPVEKMRSSIESVGGIHPDHAGQIVKHALDHIAEEGIDGARKMDYGNWQKYYDAALDAATHQDLIDAMKNYSEGGPVHMQVGGLSKIPSLVRRVGEAASKAKPFYSAVDEAIAKITQGKGTGEQFLSMIKKTPGVKPQEIKDRKLDKLLTGKMTKADVEKIATDNPPPQISETTLRGPVENGSEYRTEYNPDTQMHEVLDQHSMPVAQYKDDRDADAYGRTLNFGTAKFADTEYVTKGGTNHREILFRMPSNVPEKESALRSWHEQMKQKYKTIGWKELATTEEVSKNDALVAAFKKDLNAFKSPHYDEPNILAHARVSDRIGPNGEKIMHVDEIQSDWHQKARDARKNEIKRLVKNGMTEDDAKKAVPSNFGYSGNIKELPEGYKLEEFTSPSGARAFRVNDPQGTLYSSGMSPESATKNAIENLNVGVPDAPFKSDWHELVMKRLLDDAARNGYDRVTITPGAEQAKRYGLSKQVDQLLYKKNPDGTYQLSAQARGQGHMLGEALNEAELERQVGKDVAQRIIGGEGKATEVAGNYNPESMTSSKDYMQSLSGLDLDIGGEGMTGFYDQMLPAFVNRYGEKTGLRMNLGDTPVDGKKYKVYEDSNALPFSIVPEDGFTIAGRYATQEEADRAAIARATQPFHSIDITPEFRESVTEKGQPFYQIGAGSAIGAAAASEEEPKQSGNITTFRKGGEVNLDAMRMAVLNKQLRKRHG